MPTLVATWTDLPCHCSRNDRGSWIVDFRCPAGHLDMLTDDELADLAHAHLYHRGNHYGPVLSGVR